MNRRSFLTRSTKTGLMYATSRLWSGAGLNAFAQSPTTDYKAVVVITMTGGNDANNMLIPTDSALYAQYASLRGCLALAPGQCIPLQHQTGQASYSLHPALSFVADMYNSQKALFVANVGPIKRIVSKAQYFADQTVAPGLYSHTSAIPQWESALTSDAPTTGWGGRMADLMQSQSGYLPPVLNLGLQSQFTFGNEVQAVAVQSGAAFAALPPGLSDTVLAIAESNSNSKNPLVAQAAALKTSAMRQQQLINRAQAYTNIQTPFLGTDGFSRSLKLIAQIIAGRSVTGASKQIFYLQQGGYDTHANQLPVQFACLDELNFSLRSFFSALDEIGMTDKVLVCTLSDFNRTFAPNVNAGSDHGWGTHQMILGGGISGGRILGQMPTLELGGPDDANGLGAWLPTTAVTQLSAGVGSWMGLSDTQNAQVFPELANFSGGAIRLS